MSVLEMSSVMVKQVLRSKVIVMQKKAWLASTQEMYDTDYKIQHVKFYSQCQTKRRPDRVGFSQAFFLYDNDIDNIFQS